LLRAGLPAASEIGLVLFINFDDHADSTDRVELLFAVMSVSEKGCPL
jgi:hypothetical protein